MRFFGRIQTSKEMPRCNLVLLAPVVDTGASVSSRGKTPREFGMRLKSAIWVAAYIRRCGVEGVFAAVRRRGAEEAGAIYVVVNRLDGTADLYGPAPQTAFDEGMPIDRAFTPALATLPAPESAVDAYIARESRFDPDLWVIEIEERSGRHFLDRIVR